MGRLGIEKFEFERLASAVAMAATAGLVVSCANNPHPIGLTSATTPSSVQQAQAATLKAAKVDFHFSNFYSLTSPNVVTHCAGDGMKFYDPVLYADPTIQAPQPLPSSVVDPTITILPSFIRNVSVDLSDSNTTITSNAAYSCSYGSGLTAPPPSNCSTFDYGAAAGLYSNMSGSILMVGGIQGTNYAGIPGATVGGKSSTVACGTLAANPATANTCNPSVYALAIDTLPASTATNPPNPLAPGITGATGPISTWANLGSAQGYNGPKGMAGAAAAFDPGLRRLLVFGGVSGASNLPVTDTWIFDFASQSWSQATFSPNVDAATLSQADNNGSLTVNLAKAVGGRALFGYTALNGAAVSAFSQNGVVASQDKTDWVGVLGGYGAQGVMADSHRWNPTFGPDIVDLLADSKPGATAVQFLDSYYSQIMDNNNTGAPNTSLYEPTYPGAGNTNVFAVNMGVQAMFTSAGSVGTFVAVGGFNASTGTTGPTGSGGAFVTGHAVTKTNTGDYIMHSNALPLDNSVELSPILYSQLPEGGNTVPWYGGVSLVQGLAHSDLVYFGGSNLKDYLMPGNQVGTFDNPGRYWKNIDAFALAGVPAATAMAGAVPTGAGMAAAHGTDLNGNQIVVAWGGIKSLAPSFDPTIYYLWSNAGTPTWTAATPTGNSPSYYANASMVYSHVTGSFYLFGGYSPVNGLTGADTWQLSVSPAGCGATGNCTFTWRQLNLPGALACTPVCPTARRSHRMVEVNYFNSNPLTEPTCPANAPCSYGIFMEGGTADGVNLIGDRWMFDPTASGGNGAWIKILEMPPRSLGALASTDYFVPATNQTVHRAVVFGGEVGMENPLASKTGQYFVPPTLGDTWIFDFDNLSWNRATLLGKGYAGTPPGSLSGNSLGEAFNATTATANQREMSPPPVSGSVMVTRTNGPSGTLAIPEVYLFGGRTKDGNYLPIDHVYKFCIGTSTESPTDATCLDSTLVLACTVTSGSTTVTCAGGVSQVAVGDFVSAPGIAAGTTVTAITGGTTFTISAAPSASGASITLWSTPQAAGTYTGRWFRKAPALTPLTAGTSAQVASYLGAATYDPVDDRIVLYGGLTPTGVTASTVAVTDSSNRTSPTTIYEYTPPATAGADGSWLEVGACALSTPPTIGFYGHTMSYDSLNHQLVIVGGYVGSGANAGAANVTTSNVPMVWSAKRVQYQPGKYCYAWNPVTLFGNRLDIPATAPPVGGIAHAASLYVPASGYNTGYYMTYDSSCVKAGPIAVPDPSINKLLAGGVYFDIDRTQLGTNENLMLNLTYLPMGASMQAQDGTPLTSGDEAIFKVHLVRTAQATGTIQEVAQPRYITYAATDQFPEIVESLAVLAPPTGQMRGEQIVLPISMDSTIDRIHIQRYSGSAVLIDATLYRMGQK